MKSDLNRLMQERDLTAIVVVVGEDYCPQLDYLVGGVHVTNGLALKVPGEQPLLVVGPMEIEEAQSADADVISYNDLGYGELLKEAEGDRTKAAVELWGRALAHLGVDEGKIGVYGTGEINHTLQLVDHLRSRYPDYEFIGETSPTIFDHAAATKDPDEIERIKDVAVRTNAVLQATWNFIAGHKADGDTVVKADGSPLTIGEVKQFVLVELLKRNLEDIGMIFAQGRDAGFPHSRGQADMPLKLGQSIVFDLFPREHGGGYFHDTTRTWCIGYAPEAVQKAYDTVMESFDIAIEAYGLGKPTHLMQEAVQDFLEEKGHPTLRSDASTTVGYMHSLGHGIGLKIHESPRISHTDHSDTFQVGQVITIEPGLYYPDEGFGVRVEDSLYVAEDGSLISITSFRKDLVLPLR